MYQIFIDLEMNNVAKKYEKERSICGMEIIEIGAIMLDENFQEVSRFCTYVKPSYNSKISAKYEQLTGITTEMVANAPPFPIALASFVSWCELTSNNNYQIYAWSNSDFIQMQKEIRQKGICINSSIQTMLHDWVNLQQLFCQLVEISQAISLSNAVFSVGLTFEGRTHDALWDAKNTANLFIQMNDTNTFRKNINPMILSLYQPKSVAPLSITLGELFHFDELITTEPICC